MVLQMCSKDCDGISYGHQYYCLGFKSPTIKNFCYLTRSIKICTSVKVSEILMNEFFMP